MYSLLTVKIFPKARATRFLGFQEEILRISIKEPPEDQKANKALIRFLSEILEIPQNEITILSGKTYKQKVLKIPLPFDIVKEKILQSLTSNK